MSETNIAANYNENFSVALEKLNSSQRKAVETIEGPVLVIAGPGTGKTQIIATRIAHILSTKDAQALPHNILCLTYTEAGAVAMRKRLLQIIGTAAHRITIETFHAFCNTVIQQNVEYFGKRDWEPLDDLERFAILEEIINELEPTHPLRRLKGEIYFEAGRLSQLFSTMKQEEWSTEIICEAADRYIADLPNREEFIYKVNRGEKKKGDVKEEKVAAENDKMELLKAATKLFPVYTEKMIQSGRYDYHDMILWVIDAFSNPDGSGENLLRNYQERFQYILVDEFQDTNGAQNEILNLLTNFWDAPNIFCVGDDDQGIYEFQGARIKNINEFIERYPASLQLIVLQENYRSTQPILDTAKRVIDLKTIQLSVNGNAIDKHLLAALPERKTSIAQPLVREYVNDMQEVAGVTQHIEALRQNGIPLNEIAVLYHRHAQAATLIDLFERRGIPYQVNRNVDILELPEVQQLLSVLRYVDAELRKPYTNDFLLFEIMHQRWFGLSSVDVATISFFANSMKKPLPWRLLLRDEKFLSSLPLINPTAVRAFHKMLEHWLDEVKNITLPMLFEKIINEGGYLQWVLKSDDKEWNLQVLHTLFDFIQSSALRNPKLSIRTFMNVIEQMGTHRIRLNVMKTISSDEGVVFSTCHSAKGLEFLHVFIIGCNDKNWEKAQSGARNYSLPDTLTLTTEENKSESLRRLFYVAMSRAKEELVMSYVSQSDDGKKKVVSQFVTETGITTEQINISEQTMIDVLGDLMKEAPRPVAAQIEKSLVEKRLQNFALSPSALNAYLDCPLRFYYEQIIRIPAATNDSMAFGSAIHHALEQLFKKMKAAGDKFPHHTQMVDDFSAFMFRNKLSFTEKQFENRLELGKQLLPAFYDFYVSKWNKITVLEYFIKDVEVDGVPLKGKLDKIEFNGKEVIVVDYKTGSLFNARSKGKLDAPNEKNPLGGDYWRQLVFYKILLDHLRSKDWKMMSGLIDFIEQDAKTKQFHQFPLAVSNEEVSIVRKQIKTAYEGIMNHQFYEGCGKEDCDWCNFVNENYSPSQKINEPELA